MIFEVLEWCLTPASLGARSSGLLAEQIAIRHRAIRCRRAWHTHLESSKKFVNRALVPGGCVAVLGSGHLRDIDLRYLKSHFERVLLVDVVHPLEVRWLALFSRGQVRLVSGDLSGALGLRNPSGSLELEEKLGDALKSADVLVSGCLLSQLALPAVKRWGGSYPEEVVAAAAQRIREFHLALLQSAPRAVLVTDTARRFGNDEWTPLFPTLPLTPPAESWVWNMAPPAEHGLKGVGAELRRVEAFVLGSVPNSTKIFAQS
ncbi:MAG: hypothetical protein WCG66_01330 [bacterium]